MLKLNGYSVSYYLSGIYTNKYLNQMKKIRKSDDLAPSCIMLKNGQTHFKNFSLSTSQDF